MVLNPWAWFKKERLLRAAERSAKAGKSEEALNAVNRAAELFPDLPEVAIQRCWVLADMKNYDAAKKEVVACLERWPQNGILHMLKGEVEYAQGLFPEAKASLLQALELSGENLRIEYDLGLVSLAMGDVDRATQYFESTVKYDKTLVESRLLTMAEHYLLTQRQR